MSASILVGVQVTPRHEAIVLQKLSIMLLISAQKSPIMLLRIAHYSQK